MKRIYRTTLACGMAAMLVLSAGAAPLPPASLYRLDTPMTDSRGDRFQLRDLAGSPALVTMFYGDCSSSCPIVIETLRRTAAALGPPGRRLRIVMISLDTLRDTPEVLAAMARKQQLDPPLFRLAVPRKDADTRVLAAGLNIRYRELTGGEIGHTARITLLDGQGAVRAVTTRLEAEPEAAFVAKVKEVLAER